MAKKTRIIPRLVLLRFKLAQIVSTKLTFKMALNAFFTPREYSTPVSELNYIAQSKSKLAFVNKKEITTFFHGSSPFKVLLVHGWSGRASQFEHIGNKLKEKGISYMSFTAPAHGNSKQKQTSLVEFTETIEYLAEKHGPFEMIIGHSLGGVATMNSIKNGLRPKKIVLIATPATIKETLQDFCSYLNLKPIILTMFEDYLSRKYHENYNEHSALHIAETVESKALVIHDLYDKQVPFHHGERLSKAIKHCVMMTTEKLGHNRILADKKVIDKIVEFIN